MSTLERQDTSSPSVRRIGVGELREALRRGYDDFAALRSDVIFLTIVYPVAMLVIILAFSGAELVPMIFPFVAGGALLGQGVPSMPSKTGGSARLCDAASRVGGRGGVTRDGALARLGSPC